MSATYICDIPNCGQPGTMHVYLNMPYPLRRAGEDGLPAVQQEAPEPFRGGFDLCGGCTIKYHDFVIAFSKGEK